MYFLHRSAWLFGTNIHLASFPLKRPQRGQPNIGSFKAVGMPCGLIWTSVFLDCFLAVYSFRAEPPLPRGCGGGGVLPSSLLKMAALHFPSQYSPPTNFYASSKACRGRLPAPVIRPASVRGSLGIAPESSCKSFPRRFKDSVRSFAPFGLWPCWATHTQEEGCAQACPAGDLKSSCVLPPAGVFSNEGWSADKPASQTASPIRGRGTYHLFSALLFTFFRPPLISEWNTGFSFSPR